MSSQKSIWSKEEAEYLHIVYFCFQKLYINTNSQMALQVTWVKEIADLHIYINN